MSFYWQDLGNGYILMSDARHKPCILTAGKNGGLLTSVDGILRPVEPDNPNMALIAESAEIYEAAKQVMALLKKHGASIVPYLMDTDDNAGQRLRDALERAEGKS